MERKDVKLEDVSPMMREYLKTKAEYENVILFYRLGDFYEMFFDDAITASHELELTLTGKNAGLDESENQQAFINYVDAVEKGENADIAFQKLAKQITNGDAEKMAALNKIKNALQETQKRAPKEAMESNFGWTWFTVGVLAAALAMFMSDKLRDVDAKGLSKVSTMLGVMATLFTGLGIANDGSIYKPYSNVSKQIYNAYVNQEIQKAANPEIVKMDAKQTRQFIELAKQNGPEK